METVYITTIIIGASLLSFCGGIFIGVWLYKLGDAFSNMEKTHEED